MTCLIRPADLADVPRLKSMIHALSQYHGDIARVSEAQLHRDLFGPAPMGVALLAERALEPVGYALLMPIWRAQTGERSMDLHHLFVRHDLRGQGIGRRLVEAARSEARARGAARLTIGTAPQNHAAQDFYRHLGLTQQPQPGPRFAEAL